MPPKVQALAVVASLGLLLFIVQLVRKGRLREEYALLWLAAGLTVFVLAVWRGSLTAIASILDIGYAPSLLFAVGLLFALLILLAHTVVLSSLASHHRDLAQQQAMLEWQLQQLESRAAMAADGVTNVFIGQRPPTRRTTNDQRPTTNSDSSFVPRRGPSSSAPETERKPQ